jgi:hypothetical protein
MAGINTNKVLVGGVAAGVVMVVLDMLVTGGLLADRWNAAMERLGLPPFTEGGLDELVVFLLSYVVLGIALAFGYAAMRPRFGAGARTALIAGGIFWLATVPTIVGLTSMGVFEWSLIAGALVASLIVTVIGAYVAGWLYSET